MSRLIGLAAQTVPGLAPWRTVEIAAEAGFDQVGIAIDAETWTASATQQVRDALKASGLRAQDGEVIRLRDTFSPDQARLLDIAGELGVAHVITISLIDDLSRTREVLAEVTAHAQDRGVTPILEFGLFTSVHSWEQAVAIAEPLSLPILLDPLHLARSGGTAAAISKLPPAMLPYAQICDAGPAEHGASAARLLEEAREGRRDIGAGDLDLDAFVDALPPDLPLMNEVRSASLAGAFSDPVDHACYLAGTMRTWLAKHGEGR